MKIFRKCKASSWLLVGFFSFCLFPALAQDENTSRVLVFDDYQPAEVKLVDGRTLPEA